MERCLLVVAHPGHELRILGWVQRAQPLVLVLTDGSGGAGRSRLESTRRVLKEAGAQPGPVFGRYSDRELYCRLMQNDYEPFLQFEREILECILANRISSVVADNADAYNPMHDLCRYLVNSAVAGARRAGSSVGNESFPLIGLARRSDREFSEHLQLTDSEFRIKSEAVRSYEELQEEISGTLQDCPWEWFNSEYLYTESVTHPHPAKPYYETYGEERVAAGRYPSVLRYEQHIRPLVDLLARIPA